MKIILVALLSMSTMAADVVLRKNNTVAMQEEFNFSSTAKVSNELIQLNATLPKGEPIYLVLESPGGSVEAGLALIEVMNGLDRKINVICIYCASMGFQTLQAATGERMILSYGIAMAHKAKGGFQGEFPGQIDARFEFYKRRLEHLDISTVAKSNGKLDLKSLQNLYENEYWCTGKDCPTNGLVDRVVSVSCDDSLIGLKTMTVSTLFGAVEVRVSNCPLIRGFMEVEVEDKEKELKIKESYEQQRSIGGRVIKSTGK